MCFGGIAGPLLRVQTYRPTVTTLLLFSFLRASPVVGLEVHRQSATVMTTFTDNVPPDSDWQNQKRAFFKLIFPHTFPFLGLLGCTLRLAFQ